MKKNSELEVGDIIEVPVSHTDRVEQYTITRVTATQYVTNFGARFNKNLKKLGRRSNRNYDVYGQQPKVVESVAESVAEPVASAAVAAETETITCELNVGDVILTRVPHTTRVRKNVIERITVTQYVCGGTRFRKKDLGIVGANMWGPGYGFLPEPVEPVKTAEPVKVEPVVTAVTVDTVVETGAVAHPTPELTAADHVVVFETESQTRQVLEAANAYTRTAILVQNLESETYIVGVFKSKKAAIEAKKNVAGVGRVFDIVVQPSGCTNKAVSFYNIVMLAHAITGENHDKLVTCEHPYWCDGAKGKLYAKIATTESQPVTQEIPRFRRRDLGIVGAKYPQETRGFLPEVTEVTEVTEVAVLIPLPIAVKLSRVDGLHAVVTHHPEEAYPVVRHISNDVPNLERNIRHGFYGVDVYPKILNVQGFDGGCFRLSVRGREDIIVRGFIDALRVRHPAPNGTNLGWIFTTHPRNFDSNTPYDLFIIEGAVDLRGGEYTLEYGDGEDKLIDLTKPTRVYAHDIMWGGVHRKKVCICRHPDLDECDDDDDGFKPPHIIQPLEPWLHIDEETAGYEDMYKYPYLNKEMLS